jgi:hypothetical protein
MDMAIHDQRSLWGSHPPHIAIEADRRGPLEASHHALGGKAQDGDGILRSFDFIFLAFCKAALAYIFARLQIWAYMSEA